MGGLDHVLPSPYEEFFRRLRDGRSRHTTHGAG